MTKLILAFLLGAVIAAVCVFDFWRNRRKYVTPKYVLLHRIIGGLLMWGGSCLTIASLILPDRRRFLLHGLVQAVVGFVFLNLANLFDAVREHNDQAGNRPSSGTRAHRSDDV